MSQKLSQLLSSRLGKISAGATIVGALATVITIFVSSSDDESVSVSNVSGSTGVVAVGSGSTVGDVTTNVYGKTETEEAIASLRASEAQCRAEYRRFERLPVADYLTQGILLPLDARVNRVAYDTLNGSGAMDNLVLFQESQIEVAWSAVVSRGVLRSTMINNMMEDFHLQSSANLGLDSGDLDEQMRELHQQRLDEWEENNPLVTDWPIYVERWGSGYSYQFDSDHPQDDPDTEPDETGEFFKQEFLKLYAELCNRMTV